MKGSIQIDQRWFEEKTQEAVISAAMNGLTKCAEAILGEAKKLTPVDTGTLMRSGTVNVDLPKKFVVISFNTPYARKMHETHRKKSKYLERPFMKYKGRAQQFVERELKRL